MEIDLDGVQWEIQSGTDLLIADSMDLTQLNDAPLWFR
jgi:hypothetical protein